MAACARGAGVQNFKIRKFKNSGFALQHCHEKTCVRPLQNLTVDTRLLATVLGTSRTNGRLCVTLTRAQQVRCCLQFKTGSRHADDRCAGRSKQVSSARTSVPCTQTPAATHATLPLRRAVAATSGRSWTGSSTAPCERRTAMYEGATQSASAPFPGPQPCA